MLSDDAFVDVDERFFCGYESVAVGATPALRYGPRRPAGRREVGDVRVWFEAPSTHGGEYLRVRAGLQAASQAREGDALRVARGDELRAEALQQLRSAHLQRQRHEWRRRWRQRSRRTTNSWFHLASMRSVCTLGCREKHERITHHSYNANATRLNIIPYFATGFAAARKAH